MNDSRLSWVFFSQVWHLHGDGKRFYAPSGSWLVYVLWTLFFSHCHSIKKPIPAASQEAM